VPAAIDAALGDLSDVAVDPVNGRIWLLSDKTETIAVASMSMGSLVDVEVVALMDIADGEKPEALTFASDGELLIGTDASAKLYRYAVTR
jgi:hypothetical protein